MGAVIACIGIGVTIIMVLILLSGFMQDMNWYDNKAAFDVIKANREDAEQLDFEGNKFDKNIHATATPAKRLIKWMDYHD